MKRLLILLVILLVGCSPQVGDAAYSFKVENHQGNLVSLDDFEDIYIIAWSTT